MATYSITVNERTKSGKGLVAYLRSLGVINEANDATLSALEELKSGKVTRCKSFEEYLASVK